MKNNKFLILFSFLVLFFVIAGSLVFYTYSNAYTRQFKSTANTNSPLKDRQTQRISLYYYNLEKDRQIADWIPCSPGAVLPVERTIPATITPVKDSVELLLLGKITDTEKSNGFTTEFPNAGFSLKGANLKDGNLILEFTDKFGFSDGGSCRTGLLVQQIIKTAKQFPEVKNVNIIPDTLFQP